MRFFMFPIIVTLALSGCDKQQQEEVKAPATPPPASTSAPPSPPEAPVVPPPQAVVPQEVPPPPPSPPVVAQPVPAPPLMATPKTQPEEPALPAKPDTLTLAKQSGCLACHGVDKKIVGPAWKDVSARYKNDAEAKTKLIAKIKAGGKGNWTEVTGGMAMPAYSPRVSDHDIEILVDFILSLAS